MKIINIGTDSLFKIVDGICKLFCNIKLVFFLHRRYRYIASKVCAIEIWGTLQKYRVPIPSCVVTAIRGKFSVEAGESFEGFHYIDETV